MSPVEPALPLSKPAENHFAHCEIGTHGGYTLQGVYPDVTFDRDRKQWAVAEDGHTEYGDDLQRTILALLVWRMTEGEYMLVRRP